MRDPPARATVPDDTLCDPGRQSETNTIPYAVIWSTIGSTFILMQLGAPKEIDRVVSAMARC